MGWEVILLFLALIPIAAVGSVLLCILLVMLFRL